MIASLSVLLWPGASSFFRAASTVISVIAVFLTMSLVNDSGTFIGTSMIVLRRFRGYFSGKAISDTFHTTSGDE